MIFYLLLPSTPVDSGIKTYDLLYRENISRTSYAHAAALGTFSAFLISLLTEYFTSQSCPAAREVSTQCKNGLPLNIV